MEKTNLMPHEEIVPRSPNVLAGSLGDGITNVPVDPEACEKAIRIFQEAEKSSQSKD